MKLCIHRGTHQIGGIAAEISTASTRILIDMGDELSLDPNFVSAPLNIPGVTDGNGHCDAVLFTHYHGDHTGQMLRIRPEIPIKGHHAPVRRAWRAKERSALQAHRNHASLFSRQAVFDR